MYDELHIIEIEYYIVENVLLAFYLVKIWKWQY